MPKPNQIAFDFENYAGCASPETEMFADIGKMLKILTKNGYVCTFTCDEPAFEIYVIEFDYQDEELCNVKPYWITPEQMEKLQDLESEDTDDGTDAG